MTTQAELIRQAIDHIDTNHVLGLVRRLVNTPSITGDEASVAGVIAEELITAGMSDVRLSEFAPGRTNVTGVLHGHGGGNHLLLAGHTDTVHVDGWHEAWAGAPQANPFGAAIIEGEMWGRGTSDMKGGDAVAIAALQTIHRAGLRPRGNVVAAFVGDEESGQPGSGLSLGMKQVVADLGALIASGRLPRPDFAIYMEPTTLRIYTAQMGFIIADITIRGKSAYFGTPWLGNDALRATHKLLSQLYDYTDAIWETADHPLLGRPFCLVTRINGGGYIAVPEQCSISLIRKVLPGEELDHVRSQLDGLVHRLAINEGVLVDIAFTAGRDHPAGGRPAETDISHPGIARLSQAITSVTGETNLIQGAPFWSEMSFLNGALDIPSVYFAPGDITICHTVQERVPVQQLLDGVNIFIKFIAEYCGIERIQ